MSALQNQSPGLATPVQPSKFFGFTFLLSWLIWIPLVLSHFNIPPFHILEGISPLVRLLGVLMPAMTAVALTGQAGGKGAVQNLLRRLTDWRLSWVWWAAAVGLQPVLLITSGLVFNWLDGNPAVSPLPPVGLTSFIINAFFLALATLGEEIGWRGVALPGLQQRSNPLTASVILAVLTTVWHVPFWLLLDTFTQFGFNYLMLNALLVLPMTVYITWIFNHTRSSLLLPVAFHLAFNLVNVAWLPVTTSIGAFRIFIALLWIVTIMVIPHLKPDLVPHQHHAAVE